jgi:hypothetical protein
MRPEIAHKGNPSERGLFRLRNVTIVGYFYYLNCYMFRTYDHIQVDISSRMYSTDNGSVVFLFFLEY